MRLELDFEKSVEENASLYFERSKKSKRKLSGLAKAISRTKGAIAKRPKENPKKEPLKKRKPKWFHQFRWFLSSDGLLVVGGRSAKQNELVVKKHLDEQDLFLHADIPGGSACVVKASDPIPETTLKEAAQFAAVFSKAWQNSLPSVDVYAVSKDQVSKQAPSQTSLATGAFMIYGKRKWFRKTPLRLAVGVNAEKEVISGPLAAIKKSSRIFAELLPGKQSASDAAKRILPAIKRKDEKAGISLDEIIRMIPASGIEVKIPE